MTSRKNLGALVPSNAYVIIYTLTASQPSVLLLTSLQIRIVSDTHAHEKPNKKKKPHRGYAFVVFEREKDMRGNTTINISLGYGSA